MATSVKPGCETVGWSATFSVAAGAAVTPAIVGRPSIVLLVARAVTLGVAVGAEAGLENRTATKIAMPKKPTALSRMSESRFNWIVNVFSLPSSGSWSGELNDASCTASESRVPIAILPHRDARAQ